MKMTPMALIRRKFSSRSQAQDSSSSNAVKPDEEIPAEKAVTEPLKNATTAQSQKDVFLIKVSQCKKILNFESEAPADLKARDVKRRALLEIVEFVNGLNQNKANAAAFFTEEVLKDTIEMIKLNVFEQISLNVDDYDPEEDDPVLDPKWPHKQVVYELLLRLVISPGVNAKLAKKQDMFDQKFLIDLIQQFESEDTRERDYLKSILHRLYGKFFTHRKYIREQISYVFCSVVDNALKHSGIAELLEILGSIINGFSLPLKKEHLSFLQVSLLPLHKTDYLTSYQQQLSYCMTQYVEKDYNIAPIVIKYLYNVWPISSSTKQMIFLIEIESVLECLHPLTAEAQNAVDGLLPYLFNALNTAISGSHFQVAEKALSFWNNVNLTGGEGLLSISYAEKVLPLVLPSLLKNTSKEDRHWNEAVAVLSERTLMIYQQALGEETMKKIIDKTLSDIEKQENERKQHWEAFLASTND